MKRIRLKKLLVGFVILLLVVLAAVLLIGRLNNPDTMHLVAHYSAGETPKELPGSMATGEDDRTRRVLRQYRDDGIRLADFTESGLYLFEKGGDPLHCNTGPAVVTRRDWAGHRISTITLPAAEWRDINPSPDGQYLATVIYNGGSVHVDVWHDGQRAWTWTGNGSCPKGSFFINNNGRLFVWLGTKLYVVEKGQVIASNPHLPIFEMTPQMLNRSKMTPDGSALARSLHPRTSGLDDTPFYNWGNLPLDYLALTIQHHTVVPVRKFQISYMTESDWQILSDGSVMTTDCAVYAPDGTKGGDEGWFLYKRKGSKEDTSLWYGDTVLMHRRTPRGQRYRVYNPQAGHGAQQQLEVAPGNQILDLQPSGNGKYLLAVTANYSDPERMRFAIIDRSGKLQAKLSCRATPAGSARLAVGFQQYYPAKYAISPDGHSLVILGQRIGGTEREYLHYQW